MEAGFCTMRPSLGQMRSAEACFHRDKLEGGLLGVSSGPRGPDYVAAAPDARVWLTIARASVTSEFRCASSRKLSAYSL